MTLQVPEQYRVRKGTLATTGAIGNNGLFLVPTFNPKTPGLALRVVASDGVGWEHVSVSLSDRCPTWPEMCRVKDLFWDEEDAVMQLHPPKSTWVNNHRYCLHLWRSTTEAIPLPPEHLVGLKELGEIFR